MDRLRKSQKSAAGSHPRLWANERGREGESVCTLHATTGRCIAVKTEDALARRS